eukprot:scaffold328_cov248-Pinguiococcus_pyrenoidosus.AAC.16
MFIVVTEGVSSKRSPRASSDGAKRTGGGKLEIGGWHREAGIGRLVSCPRRRSMGMWSTTHGRGE